MGFNYGLFPEVSINLTLLRFSCFVPHELNVVTTKLHKSISYSFFIKPPVIREFRTLESNSYSLNIHSVPGRLLGATDPGYEEDHSYGPYFLDALFFTPTYSGLLNHYYCRSYILFYVT